MFRLRLRLVLSQQWIDGSCATGSDSAPHSQKALAEPVAHINTRLTEHQPLNEKPCRDSSRNLLVVDTEIITVRAFCRDVLSVCNLGFEFHATANG